MFLNDKERVINEGEGYINPMNIILSNLEKKGSLLITCLQLGFEIEDVEEMYELGQQSFNEDYNHFYNKVNAIEKKFGFEILQYDNNTPAITSSFMGNNPFDLTKFNFNPNSVIYIQQNRREYEITNIFKSHDSKKIFLSINQENNFKTTNTRPNSRSNSIPLTFRNEANTPNEISIPRPLSRKYDFTVSEFKAVINDLDPNTQIYVLKEGKAYAFGVSMHYDFKALGVFGGNPKEKLIIEIDMVDGESKYNQIKIGSSYFFDLNSVQLERIVEDLKRRDIIDDGFFEADNFYYIGQMDYELVKYYLMELVEREVDRYYASDAY